MPSADTLRAAPPANFWATAEIPAVGHNAAAQLHRFANPQLEQLAYTHASAGTLQYERDAAGAIVPVVRCNEQLEFVGDHLLKASTALHLRTAYPTLREGELSSLSNSLINNRLYASVACKLTLDQRLKVGPKIDPATLRSERVLGGLFEAYAAAVMEDMGIEHWPQFHAWVVAIFAPYAEAYHALFMATRPPPAAAAATTPSLALVPAPDTPQLTDAEPNAQFTQLVGEKMMALRLPTPEVRYDRFGPDHMPLFTCTVSAEGMEFTSAAYKTQKGAKHLAFEKLWHSMNQSPAAQ